MKILKAFLKKYFPFTFKLLKSIKKSTKKRINNLKIKHTASKEKKIKKKEESRKRKEEQKRLELLKKQDKFLNLCKEIYKKNRFKQKQMPKSLYRKEYLKYLYYIEKEDAKEIISAQMVAALTSEFILISNKLKKNHNKNEPIVFVVVRNELERMKLFFEHYRKLGIKQFVTLDNGSDDGTLEFLINQPDTKVYQIIEPFQTQKKEGWLEKIVALNGQNRWCIVVDSDELLDFIGSEEHSIPELIQLCESKGYKRIWGFMLDMYSDKPLFNCFSIGDFKFFDKNNYLMDRKGGNKPTSKIYGGPRYRLLNLKNHLSKQAIFYYENNCLYRNCHYLYPAIEWGDVPCLYVLRHYKFMGTDKIEYERRVNEGCFYNNSAEYKSIMNHINEQNEVSMIFENSVEYKNSKSFECLPFIKKINWDNTNASKVSDKSILLQGYLHNANFGDILAGSIFYERCKKAGAEQVDFYQYKDFGIGKFCRKQTGYKTVKSKKVCYKSDALVIISGGSLWNNGKDPNDAPIRYERFIKPALIFQKKKKPVYFIGVGGGPVDTPWLKNKMVDVLNKAKIITFRDLQTKEIFEQYNVSNKMTVTADTMLTITKDSLDIFEEKYQLDLAANNKKKLLLHIPDGVGANVNLLNIIVPALIQFLKENQNYFLVLSNDNIRAMSKKEKDTITKIKNKFIDSKISFYDYKYFDCWQMCSLLNEMDTIITLKLHVGVVGCSLGKNVIAFPVHREKTDNFYKMIDESDRCVNVKNLDTETAYNKIIQYCEKPVFISQELRDKAEENLLILDRIVSENS